VAAEEVGADGDLQVRVQASNSALAAINQREVRENTHPLWRHTGTGDSIFFGYSESWHTDGPHRRLGSAAIRFFYRCGLDDISTSPVQVFRFEWADAQQNRGTNEFTFPGQGAATPHWHYDGVRAERLTEQLLALHDLFEQTPTSQNETPHVRDFDPDRPREESPKHSLLYDWFGGIHFPARVTWHRHPLVNLDFLGLDPNPHAYSPHDLVQVENTMSSAVLYVRHQLTKCQP
jgi:hypothetical protein